MSELDEKFDLLKNEVDALQIALLSQQTPWYKNISIWISISALLFSFGTTLVSYERTKVQDIQALKSELRIVLQRLAQLPTQQFELSKKYKGDENAIGFLASQINQESTLLAKQSASIASKIPPELITSAEYSSVALALQNSYQIGDALRYLELALKTSESVNDEVAALRGIANLYFISGQPELGRVKYQETLNVFSKYKGHNQFVQKSTHIWTYRFWANSEAGMNRLDLANQKLDEAKKLVSTIPLSPGRNTLEKQIQQTRDDLNAASTSPRT